MPQSFSINDYSNYACREDIQFLRRNNVALSVDCDRQVGYIHYANQRYRVKLIEEKSSPEDKPIVLNKIQLEILAGKVALMLLKKEIFNASKTPPKQVKIDQTGLLLPEQMRRTLLPHTKYLEDTLGDYEDLIRLMRDARTGTSSPPRERRKKPDSEPKFEVVGSIPAPPLVPREFPANPPHFDFTEQPSDGELEYDTPFEETQLTLKEPAPMIPGIRLNPSFSYFQPVKGKQPAEFSPMTLPKEFFDAIYGCDRADPAPPCLTRSITYPTRLMLPAAGKTLPENSPADIPPPEPSLENPCNNAGPRPMIPNGLNSFSMGDKFTTDVENIRDITSFPSEVQQATPTFLAKPGHDENNLDSNLAEKLRKMREKTYTEQKVGAHRDPILRPSVKCYSSQENSKINEWNEPKPYEFTGTFFLSQLGQRTASRPFGRFFPQGRKIIPESDSMPSSGLQPQNTPLSPEENRNTLTKPVLDKPLISPIPQSTEIFRRSIHILNRGIEQLVSTRQVAGNYAGPLNIRNFFKK